jgi:hypothetical protein
MILEDLADADPHASAYTDGSIPDRREVHEFATADT